MMIRKSILAAAMAGLLVTPTLAAEAIEGTWLRPSTGVLVKFAPCGGGFCGTVQSGKYKGKSIGKMSGAAGKYNGTITDLAEEKTYKGKAAVSGNSMSLKGCVLGGLVCKGEDWQRQ
jgi:uncharacterized protein (DUF2147 family)